MVPLGLVGEVFGVTTQVDRDLTTVSGVDRRLGLIKNLGRQKDGSQSLGTLPHLFSYFPFLFS
jgi:hypothetical protein